MTKTKIIIGLLTIILFTGISYQTFAAPSATIIRSILPELDNYYEIGTTTKRYKINASAIVASSTTSETLSITGTGTTTLAGNLDVLGNLQGGKIMTPAYVYATGNATIGGTLTASNFVGTSTTLYNTFAGNVGIGTTGPTMPLQVIGKIGAYATESNVLMTGGLEFKDGYNVFRQSQTTHNLNIDVYNSNSPLAAVTIQQNGNVGIGTTAPTNGKLVVSQSSASSVTNLALENLATAGANQGSQINFIGHTAGNLMSAIAANWDGAANTDSYLTFGTRTGGTHSEKVRITSGGNLGIGTTGPVEKLEVAGAGLFTAQLANYRTSATAIDFYSGVSRIWAFGPNATTAGTLKLIVSANDGGPAVEALTVIPSGNVGIGTTVPGALLHVNSAAGAAIGDFGLVLSDADVSHGLTATSAMGDDSTVFNFTEWSSATGGARLNGASDDANTPGFFLQGAIGVTDPTDSIPAVLISGTKKNTTDVQAMGALETVLQIATGVDGATKLMTVLGSGNVGIGTTAPGDKLEVNGNIGIGVNKIYNNAANNSAGIGFTNSAVNIDGYNGIIFNSSATTIGSQTERMRITNAGNVGIGTTTPNSSLTVLGSSAGSGAPSLTDETKGIANFRTYPQTSGVSLKIGGYTDAPYSIWLQSQYDLNDTAYPIALNPLGGSVGIGTTTPASILHVSSGASATTTVDFGAVSVTAKTCFNVRNNTGDATSFYFVGTTMVVEANRCR
jgi:hypothetical protein